MTFDLDKRIHTRVFELEIEYTQSTKPLIWIGEQKVFRDYRILVAISSKLWVSRIKRNMYKNNLRSIYTYPPTNY